MEISIIIGLFILGTIMGSFYNVVGYRLPEKQSLISPPSHCTNCGHRLTPIELIPIISYIIQGGKCKKCKKKISLFYPVYEMICGILFVFAYLAFGFSFELILAITFISMLMIIIISDIEYMVISDGVLIFFGILIFLEKLLFYGTSAFYSLIWGLLAFLTMFIIKKMGDIIFKKESMGGGDIKLMALFGLMLGYPDAILAIFLGSIIGFPISVFMVKKRPNHEIPFGPFLAAGALVILLFGFNFEFILKLYGI